MDPTFPLVTQLSRLTPRVLDWLWPGRLARGKLSIFEGDPGVGKSLVTLDLCARVTTGRPFPDGSPGSAPANVIILTTEDEGEAQVPHAPDIEEVVIDGDRDTTKRGLHCAPASVAGDCA